MGRVAGRKSGDERPAGLVINPRPGRLARPHAFRSIGQSGGTETCRHSVAGEFGESLSPGAQRPDEFDDQLDEPIRRLEPDHVRDVIENHRSGVRRIGFQVASRLGDV